MSEQKARLAAPLPRATLGPQRDSLKACLRASNHEESINDGTERIVGYLDAPIEVGTSIQGRRSHHFTKPKSDH
jgi:hypothetical protein